MAAVGLAARRGFENVLANWPLLLIEIAASVAIVVCVLVIFLGGVLPMIGAYAFSLSDLQPETIEEFVESLIQGRWWIILYGLFMFTLAILVGVLIYSFVQAGIVGVYTDAERRVPEGRTDRSAFRVFTPERWWSHAKAFGWRFFWIYNVIWGVVFTIVLLPLIPFAALVILASDQAAAAVMLVCSGLVLMGLLLLAGVLLAFAWNMLAFVECVRVNAGVMQSIRLGGRAFKQSLGPVVLLFIIYFAISAALGGAISVLSVGLDFASAESEMAVLFLPVQVATSLVQSVIGVLLSSWLLAALAAVLVTTRDRSPAVA